MLRRNYRNCSCMNNNYETNSNELEDPVQNTYQTNMQCQGNNYIDCNSCGFDSGNNVFPENPMLAQSYVPIQYINQIFKPEIGLQMGTIFPELVSTYTPGQDMREIEYLRTANNTGEGANQWMKKKQEILKIAMTKWKMS